jgi:hypothetical protein
MTIAEIKGPVSNEIHFPLSRIERRNHTGKAQRLNYELLTLARAERNSIIAFCQCRQCRQSILLALPWMIQ